MLKPIKEVQRRRTFAIISHPDAGKTTVTEKLLLYGGAIQMAGMVKAKKTKKFATSDWMELEKKRGISVTSSVMKFPYGGCEINLIDTPGHQDFSEDTYRTLTAVDSCLMLIDAANGVEAQTIKLFEVCAARKTPVIAFINKMDREGKDPFELIDNIEKVLGIECYPMTWPLGMGDRFRGVYDRVLGKVFFFEKDEDKSKQITAKELPLDSEDLLAALGEEVTAELKEQVEMLETAGNSFSHEKYLRGELAPVYFGSALNNFGVETLLKALVDYAPPPLPRPCHERVVDPNEEAFSAFIFKIQANMDPGHRDRVAFMRICSGRFERGMKSFHVRQGREFRLARPTVFMAQDRSLIDEAYAGDIVGIHDPGVFQIGDSLSQGEILHFQGIPVFAPEHFVRVDLKDPLKSKQLYKALDQLSEEGAVQVFRPIISNDQYLGVVGVLQFDVIAFRIEHEYGVRIQLTPLPYKAARWVSSEDKAEFDLFTNRENSSICLDQYDRHTLLLPDVWRLKFISEKYPKLRFEASREKEFI